MKTYPDKILLERFMIMNFLDITDTIGTEHERVLSILKDIRKELDAGRIINNIVVASDNQDTQWLFDVLKVEKGFYNLEFTGTAK